MSDRDASHMLLDLQEARAEIDLLRRAIEAHRLAMANYKGAEFDEVLWLTISTLPKSIINE